MAHGDDLQAFSPQKKRIEVEIADASSLSSLVATSKLPDGFTRMRVLNHALHYSKATDLAFSSGGDSKGRLKIGAEMLSYGSDLTPTGIESKAGSPLSVTASNDVAITGEIEVEFFNDFISVE